MRPFGLRRVIPSTFDRRVFPSNEEWPRADVPDDLHSLPSVPDGECANDKYLQGFMRKKHGSSSDIVVGEQARWASRFVWCDDNHGRLNYAHKTFGRPRLAMPLQDVKRVRAIPSAQGETLCFEVECPPHRLVLEAPGEEQCLKWVSAIEKRAAHWKRQAELEGNLTATPTLDSPDAPQHQYWQLKQSRHVW